jgi:DNA (cytosine-5)-methyltransferase 1
MSVANAYAFADFFCGSGLVTEALKPDFRPAWANDHDPRKLSVYAANHGPDHLRPGKIEEVRGGDLPAVDLSWGSFPCQDLSLAGKLAGLAGGRSGLVRQWLRVLDEMPRMPGVVALENVQGLVSAGRGDHYREVHVALEERGYRVGCLLLNAMDWVPQSRPRVFVIGLRGDDVPVAFRQDGPGWQHPQAVRRAAEDLGDFVWWKLPRPKSRVRRLEDLIEWDHPVDAEPVSRHNMGLIPTSHRTRLDRALAHGFKVAPGYRRTRAGRQVLELRFDGVSGCLRTPGGGSSRQLLVMRRDGPPATRFLSAREAARLMGAPDSYRLPTSYNDAYRAMGDAVVVPVVRHLSRHLLRPLAEYLRAERTGRHETDPGLKFRLPE